MKKYLWLTLAVVLAQIIVPLSVFGLSSKEILKTEELHSLTEEKTTFSNEITVYNSEKEETEIMDFREYIIGVVAGEMPVVFHSEALSALTCAAATLARRNMLSSPDEELSGAVISTDPARHQAFMTKEEMKERWGDDFSDYYKKLEEAVDSAIDYTITFENEPILAVYHAISPGKTENAENVWLRGYTYLVSRESEGDKISPKYLSEKFLKFSDFKEEMTKHKVEFPEDKTQWFSAGEYTKAGTLKNIKIGNKNFSGEDLREIFSLRSNAITLSLEEDGVLFTVKGYGHGVGMSQYGADYYARQGYSWQEIIKHYYTGVEIEII